MAIQDKKLREKQKAEEHKQRLADIKARRRGEPVIDRNAPVLNETPIFLIYCEGKNTEPSYFNKFKFPFLTPKRLIISLIIKRFCFLYPPQYFFHFFNTLNSFPPFLRQNASFHTCLAL